MNIIKILIKIKNYHATRNIITVKLGKYLEWSNVKFVFGQ